MRKSNNFRDYYDIIETVEEGFCSIYKAKLKNTNEKREIKVFTKSHIISILRQDLLREPTDADIKPYIDCFYQEINNMKIVEGENKENNNAVKFYEYFDNKEEFAIVMELCEQNLLNFLSSRKDKLNAKEICKIMKDLNNTFKIMSKNKIIYRDLNLENILINFKNKEKTDYIVKLKLNNTSNVMMKLNRYLSSLTKNFKSNCLNAPEILKEEIFEEKCDLWSIGILIYVLFFKQYPYNGKTKPAILAKIEKYGQQILNKTGNKELDDLILKLLVKDPKKRINWDEYFNHPFFVLKKNYTLGDKIGSSGYAIIYKAKILETGEERAVKVFNKSKIISEFMQENLREPTKEEMKLYIDNFNNEFQIMKIITDNNKNIKNTVRLYDYENKDEIAIIMELCDDNLLNILSKSNEAMKPEQIFSILNQLNNIFEIMVEKSIVHRNLKLENILIKYENKEKTKYIPKLKFTNESCLLKDLSNSKISLTNIKMIAPEILEKQNYDEKSDLWSLGVIIYLLSFKEYPYNEDNKKGLLQKIKESGKNSLKKTGNQKLDDLIEKLLVVDPKKRITWGQYFSLFKEQDFRLYYDIIKKIGEGSFGLVYEVKKKNTNEKRAVKIFNKDRIIGIIQDDINDDESEVISIFEDLFNEIENMKIVEGKNRDNMNTVKFYEYFENEKEFAIVMELCDENLSSYLKSRQPLSTNEIWDILDQLNNTFKIMDENKLAHRDMKLSNILIKHEKNGKNIFKIADYGMSKKLINISKFRSNVGTLSFKAPEIIEKGEHNLKCDLWSLGVIIYKLCFKKYPYRAEGEFALINEINTQGQKNFERKGNLYLDDLIRKLLVKNPINRLSWKEYFEHPFISKKERNNEIIIKLKVGKNDSKDKKGVEFKNIYFLENEQKEKVHNKELNSTNCILYINNEQKDFKKYFKPTNIGIYEIKIKFKNPLTDCSYMFYKCNNIINIDLSLFYTSNVTNMNHMFNECLNLKEINIDKIKVNKVTDMSFMFTNCCELEKIIFPETFITENLENMTSMFYCCQNLKDISFPPNFTTNKVTNMKTLFGKCYNIKKINLNIFNTEQVKDMSYMFNQCNSLEEIVINNKIFKTDNVTNMVHMFSECNSLKEINTSEFNFQNVKFASYMFYNCKNLKSITLLNENINKNANISHMFDGCSSIIEIFFNSFIVTEKEKIENMFDNIPKKADIYVKKECINEYKKLFNDIQFKILN